MVQNLKSVLLEWKGNRNLTQPDFSNFLFFLASCSNSDLSEVESHTPNCEARLQMEHLQDPEDFERGINIIPDQILIKRCSGSCQSGNIYHRCVPTRQEKKSIKVIHHPLLDQNRQTCHQYEITEDVECQCGCRISESDCFPHSVSLTEIFLFVSRNLY